MRVSLRVIDGGKAEMNRRFEHMDRRFDRIEEKLLEDHRKPKSLARVPLVERMKIGR